MYHRTTKGVAISVEPFFLEDQSTPETGHYVWAYHVVIQNHGAETVQLKSRYWRITDSYGRVQEVRGDGVVGEQPTLAPGQAFEYTSGTPLAAPSGVMVGAYTLQTSRGDSFDAAIPAFSLDSPFERRSLN